MALLEGKGIRLSLTALVCFAIGILALRGQRLMGNTGAGVTTQQRLESEDWWPTMSTSPRESYTGTTGCVTCHEDVRGGPPPAETAMARAASRVSSKEFLQVAGGKFESGELRYFLQDTLGGLEMNVSRDDATASQKLDWAMGAGEFGRTFVYQRDGHWFQSRLSEYRVPPTLDVTTGLKIPATMDAGEDLSSALGKVLTTEEIRHCFSCHTVQATSSKGFNPMHAEAGLGCEACHGPGAAHVKSASSKMTISEKSKIFNPAKLSPPDSIDFCGACHRTFGDVTQAANPANDSSVVRFQPYRLAKSKCWRKTQDARLTCVACHDPHLPLVRDDVSYDKRCRSCHQSGGISDNAGKACPTGAKVQCVRCHMQKVKIASMHGEFTDHFIRVVKPGEAFQQ